MGRLFLLFALADLALMVFALIDCLSTDEHEIRALPRVVWVFIILLFSPFGAIAWLLAGRPQRDPARRASWLPGNSFPAASRPRRPLAPDDDPDFLRDLNTRAKRDDEELLRQWEEDLRRREDEPRRDDDGSAK
jgi:hypothetical protein